MVVVVIAGTNATAAGGRVGGEPAQLRRQVLQSEAGQRSLPGEVSFPHMHIVILSLLCHKRCK